MASWDKAVSWPSGLLHFACGPCLDSGRPPSMMPNPFMSHQVCVNAGGKNGLPVCSACRTSIKSDAQHAWCSPTCRGRNITGALHGPAPGAYLVPRNKNPCATWADYQVVLATPRPVPAGPVIPAQAAARPKTYDPDAEAENSAIITERAREALSAMAARGHLIPTILVLDTRQANDEVIACGKCGFKGKIHMKRGATEKYSGAVMAFDCKALAQKAKP